MKYSYYHLLSISLLLPSAVFAQTPDGSAVGGQPTGTGGGGISIPNPLGDNMTLTMLFTTLLDILLIFAVPIVAFFIIYAGFLYVTARGNTETITKAHRALLYAIIGGLLILGANVLINVIQGTVDAVRQ